MFTASGMGGDSISTHRTFGQNKSNIRIESTSSGGIKKTMADDENGTGEVDKTVCQIRIRPLRELVRKPHLFCPEVKNSQDDLPFTAGGVTNVVSQMDANKRSESDFEIVDTLHELNDGPLFEIRESDCEIIDILYDINDTTTDLDEGGQPKKGSSGAEVGMSKNLETPTVVTQVMVNVESQAQQASVQLEDRRTAKGTKNSTKKAKRSRQEKSPPILDGPFIDGTARVQLDGLSSMKGHSGVTPARRNTELRTSEKSNRNSKKDPINPPTVPVRPSAPERNERTSYGKNLPSPRRKSKVPAKNSSQNARVSLVFSKSNASSSDGASVADSDEDSLLINRKALKRKGVIRSEGSECAASDDSVATVSLKSKPVGSKVCNSAKTQVRPSPAAQKCSSSGRKRKISDSSSATTPSTSSNMTAEDESDLEASEFARKPNLSRCNPHWTNELEESAMEMWNEMKTSHPDYSKIKKLMRSTFPYRLYEYENTGHVNLMLQNFPALRKYNFIKDDLAMQRNTTWDSVEAKLEEPMLLEYQRFEMKNYLSPDAVISAAREQRRSQTWNKDLLRDIQILSLGYQVTKGKLISKLYKQRKKGEKPFKAKDHTPSIDIMDSLGSKGNRVNVYCDGERVTRTPNFYEAVLCAYSLYWLFNICYEKNAKPLFELLDTCVG